MLSHAAIEEEIQLTIGDVRYLLISNQKTVLRRQLEIRSADCYRIISPTSASRAMIRH